MARPTTRSDALHVVRETLRTSPIAVNLYGSWARGDFHFDHGNRTTFSDLDLQGDPDHVSRWESTAESLRSRLSSTMDMRVSIRHADVHDRLTLPTSGWVALATYASCLRGPTGNTPQKKAYLTAKVLLLLHREHIAEPLGSVAARLDSPSARFAFAVKTGKVVVTSLPEEHVDALRTPLPAGYRAVLAELFARPHDPGAALERIRARIAGPELSPETYAYVLRGMRAGK